ncbi:MAG: protein adenylyltransferase SelO family protein, partial [Geitlerinemataceae cyanobacterium]
SITGESFDYGPYAFVPTYNPKFTAAYFDYYGRYCYGNQPLICKLNLELLQEDLQLVIDRPILEAGLQHFDNFYRQHYRERMMARLGFECISQEDAEELLQLTVKVLSENEGSYPEFFIQLRQQFHPDWREDINLIFAETDPKETLQPWRAVYHRILQKLSREELDDVASCLRRSNSTISLIRSEVEKVWEPIFTENNWQLFYDLLNQIRE